MRTALALVSIAMFSGSCGPKTLATTPPEAAASDEPWVKEHIERVEEACECETSDCLDSAKEKLDDLEGKHGGLEESPADVHKSRGKFEECYAKGTTDPVRDLRSATDLLCRCTNVGCVDKALIARLNYQEKYGTAKMTSAQATEIGGLNARFDGCKREKIISAAKVAEHADKVAAAVCACAAGAGCGLELTGLPEQPIAAKYIDYTDAIRDRLKETRERLCNCAVNGGVVGTFGGISTQTCPKPEE